MLGVSLVDSFPYRLVLLLHLFSVIVAFAPAFTWPVVRVAMRKRNDEFPEVVARQVTTNDLFVHGPALVAAGGFGVLLILLSDEAIQFSDMWVSIAFVLWFLMLGVLFLGLIPAERKAADPSDTPGADSRVSMFGGMLHLLLVLQLAVMIWQPS